MHRAYHLTPLKYWQGIQNAGFIQPKSLAGPNLPLGYKDGLFDPKDSDLLKRDSKHVVGALNSPDFEDWKEFGLFDDLVRYISKRKKKNLMSISYKELAILSFEIPNSAFIRDHSYHSPKVLEKLIGKDYLTKTHLSDKKKEFLFNQLEKYYNSTLKITDYQGSFLLPEVWIPEMIPLENITLEKVLSI